MTYDSYIEVFGGLVQKGRTLLSSAGVTTEKLTIARSLDMCYHGQGYDVPLSLRGEQPSKKEFEDLAALFEKAYREKYSVAGFSKSIDVTAYKVTVSANALKLPNKILDHKLTGRESSTKRAFDPDTRRFATFRVLSRYTLKKGEKIRGPALIQEVESTTVLPSKSLARVDEFRNLVVESLG